MANVEVTVDRVSSPIAGNSAEFTAEADTVRLRTSLSVKSKGNKNKRPNRLCRWLSPD